ncbi:HopJ type III effector protein [Porticoccus sp.]
MSVETFLEKLKASPESIAFSDTIAMIDENYDFQETAFTNGGTENGAGQNNGSCKIFAFGQLNGLSEQQTLHCFGDYYRVDVQQNPEGDDHQNIRNFIERGWGGIGFSGKALTLK